MDTIIQKPILHIDASEVDIDLIVDILGEDSDTHKEIYLGNTGRLNEPIKIDVLREHLNVLKENGCNYVSILYHTDHQGYELDGLYIGRATQQEIDEQDQKDKDYQLDYLRRQLVKAEASKYDIEKAIKRLTGE